ncbi:hypothetical protein EDC94DRAFT_510881, partial [Helicostylum pulchrum]
VDIVGFTGFVYSISSYEDVIVAKKLTEKNMFFPSDDDDLRSFIKDDTLDRLLNYSVSILYLRIKKIFDQLFFRVIYKVFTAVLTDHQENLGD